jgi:hypothetical protein
MPVVEINVSTQELETVNEESRSSHLQNGNDGLYTDTYGSTDSLTELIRASRSAPQRRRPSAPYKVADEESPLLGEGEGTGGGSEESQAKIV